MTFRFFFLRGLAIILPTVLTIWILVAVYQFVEEKIAVPINSGIRQLVLVSGWPDATDEDYLWLSDKLASNQVEDFEAKARIWAKQRQQMQEALPGADFQQRVTASRMDFVRKNMEWEARAHQLKMRWNNVTIGEWHVLDISGLIVAAFIIYIIGRLLGGFLGRGMIKQGERLLLRVPVFKQIYPYVKQVTDFFVGDKEDKIAFSNVVGVEYPRKGLWSVGLVTGNTMRIIQDAAGEECLTVFVPSSPTPFTGYVITVPKKDTINLPITIDDALRFAVSGGVIVPANQEIPDTSAKAVEFQQPATDAQEDDSANSSTPRKEIAP